MIRLEQAIRKQQLGLEFRAVEKVKRARQLPVVIGNQK
jgi:hypothetical protein